MPIQTIKFTAEWWTPAKEAAKAKEQPGYIPARFKIQPLTFGEREMVGNLLGADSPMFGSIHHLRVKGGLRGWEGISGPEGDIAYKGDKDGRPSDEQLALLPQEVIQELAAEIWKRSTVSEATRGN